MNEDTVKNISGQMDMLDKKANEFRTERDSLLQKVDECIEKRNILNKQFQEQKQRIGELKSKRDSLNAEVQKLKKLRDDARKEIGEKRTKVQEYKDNLEKTRNHIKGNSQKTKDEMEKLEWEIQTNPYPPNEERRVIARIAELEEKLKRQQKKEEFILKIRKITKDIQNIDHEATSNHVKLVQLVDESEKYHQAMMKMAEKATNVKSEADMKHQTFIQLKGKVNNIQKKYLTAIAKIKALRNKMKEFYERGATEKQEELKKKLEDGAVEKLRNREKLSFEEFKILIEKGQV